MPLVAVAMARKEQPNRFEFETALLEQGCRWVAGVDEAGRGPLAGPVVAAAVVLPAAWYEQGMPPELQGLNDSKQLSAGQRDRFFALLTSRPAIHYAIAQEEAEIIDQLNILQATHRAMIKALKALPVAPHHVLVDGRPVKAIPFPQTALVKGDSRSYSIAAASVLAKVTRDRIMEAHDGRWPHYGFAEHKGYPTPRHMAALAEHGPCPIHRRSFAPLRPEPMELF